jgi:hypothetical protein
VGPPTAHPLAAFRSLLMSLSSTGLPRMDLASRLASIRPRLRRFVSVCLRRRSCQVQLAIREELDDLPASRIVDLD